MNDKLYKFMNWPRIEDIVYSECDNPHEILGMHKAGLKMLVQAYFPAARSVSVCVNNGEVAYSMEKVDENGFFAALIPQKDAFPYFFLVQDGKREKRVVDPYCFKPIISADDILKFEHGIHYEVYRMLGAHCMTIQGVQGVHFAIWAPNAMRVSVVGDFNDWDGRVHQMRRLQKSGIFELFIPGVAIGSKYKFELKLTGGRTYLKTDPFAFSMESNVNHASIVESIDSFLWTDSEWIKSRVKKQAYTKPLHMLEVDSDVDGNDEDYALKVFENAADKAKSCHYTHISCMPMMESATAFQKDYLAAGFFALMSKCGSPQALMKTVNQLHEMGIGVVLDLPIWKFSREEDGLSSFDGTSLFEHCNPKQGLFYDQSGCIFNTGRKEVSNFLIACALFWVEVYHFDGIRICGADSMLYLDYGKKPGDWVPNMFGGNENLDNIELFKHLNSILKKRNKGVITIAEDASLWPNVTLDVEKDGLGFDYKWNTTFVNDFLKFMKSNDEGRKHSYNHLTSSVLYAFGDRFILPFSHRILQSGLMSLENIYDGSNLEKQANARLAFAFMMLYPGKKLLFEGTDDDNREPWWDAFVRNLGELYTNHTHLYEYEHDENGFSWIDHMDQTKGILSFVRHDAKKEDSYLVIANFSHDAFEKHRIGVLKSGKYKEVFNTDDPAYGGSGFTNPRVKSSKAVETNGHEQSISVKVAPYSLQIYRYIHI